MLLKEMVSMESKGQPGVALVASPLLSSQSSDQFRVFFVSPSPRCKITRGVFYIVDLDQDEFMEIKIALKGHMRPEMGPTTRPGKGHAWWALLSTSHSLLFPEKMTWQEG
jgi:hypothetical protein